MLPGTEPSFFFKLLTETFKLLWTRILVTTEQAYECFSYDLSQLLTFFLVRDQTKQYKLKANQALALKVLVPVKTRRKGELECMLNMWVWSLHICVLMYEYPYGFLYLWYGMNLRNIVLISTVVLLHFPTTSLQVR